MASDSSGILGSVTTLTVAMVKQLVVGEPFSLPVLIKSTREGTTRTQQKYLTATFGDATGDFVSTIFANNPVGGLVECNVGKAILFSGVCEHFNTAFRPKLTHAVLLSQEQVDALGSRLRFAGPFSVAVLEDRINAVIESIQGPELKSALNLVYRPRRDAFFARPAAVYHHHSYTTGLAEHTCSLLGLADMLAAPGGPYAHHKLDMDIVRAALLLHDLGKIDEYSEGETPEMTPEGKMIGHIMYAAIWFSNACLTCKVPKSVARAVMHAVLAHHGERAWGSPVEPCTPEAVFVHNIDRLDAQMGKLYMATHGFSTDLKLVGFPPAETESAQS